VIRADEFGVETPASNNAGQLLRLAPEMERLLRNLEWSGASKDRRYPDHHTCPECAAEEMAFPHGAPEPHLICCKLGALLSAVAPPRKA
jgi:hypothetical protein